MIILDFDIPWENVDDSAFGYLLEVVVLLYAFIGLAIICDDHLVPSLDTLCTRWKIPEDVAGATFMAFGSAAPEIVIAAVTTIQSLTREGGEEDAEKAADDISLGVSSIVGSGLIAFSLIPAICGLASSKTLTLKRRHLLRDELAYLISLSTLMYIIYDGKVHAWEAAILLVVYILYLLVIIFARSVRGWYIQEVLGETYNSLRNDPHQNLMHDEEEYIANDTYTPPESIGPVILSFKKRPLGFRIRTGEGEKGAFVAGLDIPEDSEPAEYIQIGSQITEIGGINCVDKPFQQISQLLQTKELPLAVTFRHDTVESWSVARCKQWWEHGLPPACQPYINIVEDCQLDGSDLLDLDWEMLEEFGVKKIHGMKILKAIKGLMGSRHLLGVEVQRVVKQLEFWEVDTAIVSNLRQDLLGKLDDAGDNGSIASSQESDHEPSSCLGWTFHYIAKPMEILFYLTCPDCELGTPKEHWYPITFLMSFIWISVFSFFLSSIVERWVDKSGVDMEFFGLILVSVAAQVPDTLESLAVAKKGYGSMAVANCLGTQTINIGIGLGIPWLISSSTGGETLLPKKLLIPGWFMIGLLFGTLAIFFSDVIIMGRQKIVLTKLKSWLLIVLYFVAIGGYAIYVVLR